jgi:hypothetical protein
MTRIEPYIKTLFYVAVSDIGFGDGSCARADDFKPKIKERLISTLSAENAPTSITNLDAMTDDIFSELVGANVFKVEDHGFAGKYFFYKAKPYSQFRSKLVERNEIIAAYNRVGKRYFQDMFAGYLAQQSPEERELALRGELLVPASDRIVTLGDNAPKLIEEISTLREAVRSDNDPDQLLVGRRERIDSELSAGQELLRAPSVRVAAIMVVLYGTLRFIAKEFAGGVIGEIASKLLEHLASIFG